MRDICIYIALLEAAAASPTDAIAATGHVDVYRARRRRLSLNASAPPEHALSAAGHRGGAA